MKRVKYIDHMVIEDGVQADPEKVVCFTEEEINFSTSTWLSRV